MVVTAALRAHRFLAAVRRQDGTYHIDTWPRTARRCRLRRRPPDAHRAARAAARLRVAQRLTAGFLDPVEDALYLTAGLRALGFPATFHLGRELLPASPPAGCFAWVEYAGEVVSTSLPVRETYLEIHRSGEG